jgi:PAS domain-containing protein
LGRDSARPAEQWPQALKTAAGIVLSSKFPMFLAWGEQLTFLYNDGYAEILGQKHPAALGRPFQAIWAEIWDDIYPIVAQALAGEATFWEDLPLIVERRGEPEQAWFTFSYSPLRGDGGAVQGMFCTVNETSAGRAERQRVGETERLRELFKAAPSFMAVSRGPDHVFEMANEAYLQLVGHRDIIGRPVRVAFPDLEGQGLYELLDRVYRTGEPFKGRGLRLAPVQRPGRAAARCRPRLRLPADPGRGGTGGGDFRHRLRRHRPA